MDEREMTTGVIPLRHASLPGHVKLPRRYEKAAMGTNGIPTRVRKISIQPGHSPLGDSLSDRMSDLMAAVMWVKQELVRYVSPAARHRACLHMWVLWWWWWWWWWIGG